MPRLVGKNRPQGEQAQCGVTTGFESGACFWDSARFVENIKCGLLNIGGLFD